ncbi:MAG: nitroreductase family protein [bacterium]|nr:nitroreductase family protein [bacterium]
MLDETVKIRRSIRKYRQEIPPEEDIARMLELVRYAPSPSNSQPVRFIKCAGTEIREKLKNALDSGYTNLLQKLEKPGVPKKIRNHINVYYRYSQFMFEAPLLFALAVEEPGGFSKKLFEAGVLDRDIRQYTDGDISAGLALNTFLLKGAELGIGTCVLTAPLTFMRGGENLLPDSSLRIVCFITAGYPDETPGDLKRKPIEELYMEI